MDASGKTETKILSFPNDYGIVSWLEVFPVVKQGNDKASFLLAFDRRVATRASLPSGFRKISNRPQCGWQSVASHLLKEQMLKTHHRENYMTVPAAIRELEKIEIVQHIDREYSMDYAVTATQKSILKAFDLAETNVRKQAAGINEDLKSYNTKEA